MASRFFAFLLNSSGRSNEFLRLLRGGIRLNGISCWKTRLQLEWEKMVYKRPIHDGLAMKNTWLFTLICTAIASFAITTNTNAQVVFSNDFEDGDLTAEIGSMTLVAGSATPSVVTVTGGTDATLGNNVALLDFDTTALDLTLNFTDTLSLANGNTVSLDFDVAARRTNGNSRTIFVDAIDSAGNTVVRFVLGDANAFGNGGNDRQRPGFATSAGGNSVFGNPPGSFWFGSDPTPVEFDATRDSHMSLTIGESSFDFSTTRQDGTIFSTTGVSNFGTGTSTDIAEVRITSNGATFGMYFDNLVAEGVVDVPACLLGDVNVSGTVDFLDIAPFIAVLTGGVFRCEADVDESGTVDFSDIAPFIAILSGV